MLLCLFYSKIPNLEQLRNQPFSVTLGLVQLGHICEILSQISIVPMQTLTTHEHWVFATLSRHTQLEVRREQGRGGFVSFVRVLWVVG